MNNDSYFNKDTYEPAVKNAKKKSFRRTLLTSIVVTLVTLFLVMVVFFISYQNMQQTMEDHYKQQRDEVKVQGANLFFDRNSVSYSIESAINQVQYVKNIDGIPYTWYNERTHFNLFNRPTTLYDQTITSNDNIQFYRNGQRVMNFLYPGIQMQNEDLEYLRILDPLTKVEVAISFKEENTLVQVLEDFPNAAWAWVIDPMNRELIERELEQTDSKNVAYVNSEYAYGFTIQSEKSNEENILEFQKALQRLSVEDEQVKKLYESTQESLEIGGIVVTGTVEALLPLMVQESVNNISLGVIIPIK